MKIRLWRAAAEPETTGVRDEARPRAQLWSNAFSRVKRAQRTLAQCRVRLAALEQQLTRCQAARDRLAGWQAQVGQWAAAGRVPPAGELEEIVTGLALPDGELRPGDAESAAFAALRFFLGENDTVAARLEWGCKAVAALEPAADTRELFYEVGAALAAQGRAGDAAAVFARMLAADLGDYRDVRIRAGVAAARA